MHCIIKHHLKGEKIKQFQEFQLNEIEEKKNTTKKMESKSHFNVFI